MIYKTQTIESYCPKCRFMSEHVVYLHKNRPDQRAQCTTCKAEHKFYKDLGLRVPEEVKQGRKGRKKGAGTTSLGYSQDSSQAKEAWEETLGGGFNFKTCAGIYIPQAAFNPGDLILHLTFGPGIVIKVEEPSRIKVLFESGVKTLAQRINPGSSAGARLQTG